MRLLSEASKWTESPERCSGGNDTCLLKEDWLFAKQQRGERYYSEGQRMCVNELRDEIMQHIQRAESN